MKKRAGLDYRPPALDSEVTPGLGFEEGAKATIQATPCSHQSPDQSGNSPPTHQQNISHNGPVHGQKCLSNKDENLRDQEVRGAGLISSQKQTHGGPSINSLSPHNTPETGAISISFSQMVKQRSPTVGRTRPDTHNWALPPELALGHDAG